MLYNPKKVLGTLLEELFKILSYPINFKLLSLSQILTIL